jgi:predicted acetyltransferase
MSVHIRTIDPAETAAWFASVMTAFLERVDPDAIAAEVLPLWDFRRVWAAFEDATIVGTARSWGTELTLPGGTLLAGSAVAGVTVRPTHRRRGILSQLMAVELAGARERGEAVALLYASEYPIYGRFGFGPAVPMATWTVASHDTRLRGRTPPGAVTIEPASRVSRDTVRRIFHDWRPRQPGEIWRREFTWDDDLGLRTATWSTLWKGFVALHHDAAGHPDGYVRYHVDEKWEQRQPRNVLHVDELHALGDAAYADLWRFVLDVDLVVTVRAERRSPAERLPWLLSNARAAQASDVADGLWLALLDVPRALAARSYERTASLVIETVGGPGVAGDHRTRVLLDASPEGATCVSTDRAPDLTLDVAALSAAYLGGARLRDDVLAQGADEHRPGALAEADALFRMAELPWCSTGF